MKLSILVQNGALAGQRRELTSGTLNIGRESACELKFDANERLVSKRHATISAEPDGFYLTDNGSTNGTFVNGARVNRVKLNNNDIVQIGGASGVQAVVTIEQTANVQSQQFVAPPPQNNFVENRPPAPPQNFSNNWQQPQQTQNAPQYQQPAYQNYNQNVGSQNLGSQNFAQPTFAAPSFAEQNYASPPNQIGNQSFAESLTNKVLFNPDQAKPKSETGKYVGIAIGVIVAVFLALLVTALMFLQLGIIPALIATVVAFLPALVYVVPLLWLDRYDPEPPLNLAFAFAWGALVSIVFSLVINTTIGILLGDAAAAIISAPIFEEGSKGLGVLLLLLFFRRDFDGMVDGIVYAGVIALGFATVENVLYYGRGLVEHGLAGLGILFIMRGILSPFAHVIFTSMTGIGCGIARETHNKALRFIMPLAGYIGAVILHALWNGVATLGGLGIFLIVYVIFEIPFFLLFVGFAVYVMMRENKILKQTLAVEVAKGVITKEQMEIATSAFRSLGWTLSGISNGKFWARRKFLRAVSKLGLAWWHIQRAQAAQGETRSFGQLPIFESEVKRWRTQI